MLTCHRALGRPAGAGSAGHVGVSGPRGPSWAFQVQPQSEADDLSCHRSPGSAPRDPPGAPKRLCSRGTRQVGLVDSGRRPGFCFVCDVQREDSFEKRNDLCVCV